ncbi:MAG: T9SS type A sorting domain-containing protein [Salinivirgaceae bacterium]
MRKILLVALFLGGNFISAQELVTTSGETFSNTNYQMSFSLGETLTETFSSEEHTLTQGFQQGNLTVTSVADPVQTGLSVSVYPNPVQNHLTIETDVQGAKYRIINIQGKVVKTGHITETALQIDFSYLSNGTYLLNVNGQNTHKIIKQ